MSGRKLVAWACLVGALILLAYAGNAAGPALPDDLLYRYSTAIAVLVQYAIISAVVLIIARGVPREVIGFRAPASLGRAAGLIVISLLAIWAASWFFGLILDASEEQGLGPDEWDSNRAGAFVANFAVFVAPVVEETTHRGLGFAGGPPATPMVRTTAPERARMSVTAPAGGFVTATNSPSGLAVTLCGPARDGDTAKEAPGRPAGDGHLSRAFERDDGEKPSRLA